MYRSIPQRRLVRDQAEGHVCPIDPAIGARLQKGDRGAEHAFSGSCPPHHPALSPSRRSGRELTSTYRSPDRDRRPALVLPARSPRIAALRVPDSNRAPHSGGLTDAADGVCPGPLLGRRGNHSPGSDGLLGSHDCGQFPAQGPVHNLVGLSLVAYPAWRSSGATSNSRVHT